MGTIFIYLLHASAGIILFYLVYWLFLRKETFHAAKRWFLILTLLSALLLPLFPLQYSVIMVQQNNTTVFQTISDTFKNIPVITEPENTAPSFNWQQVILVVYITGAAIFLLRLLTQTFVLLHLMVKYHIKLFNGVRMVENEKYGLPFSFFNIVFINPKFHTQDELPEILAHEKVHIRENHWFDLLFIELLTVIFWFNPFIWFFERSIKQNHEYLADKGVLAQGHTVARYQAILVNQLMGMQIIGITNNLNFALSTNRLKMMTKKKTPTINRAKFAWILPIVALLLFAFAEPEYRYAEEEIVESKNSIEGQKGEKELTIHGKVIHEDTKEPIPGASVVIKGTTIGTVVDRDGTFTLVDPNPEVESDSWLNSTIVISFVGLQTVETQLGASKKQLENTNGVISGVFKMKDAVVLIDTKMPPPPLAPKTKIVSGTPPPPPPPPKEEQEVRKVKIGDKELNIVDDLPGEEKEVFFVVEDMPKYPGGYYEMILYVQDMQKKLAKDKGLKGKAKVSFTVDASGKVSDIKVVEKDNDMAAKGAYTIAKEMEGWTPGKQRGKPVPVKYLLPVEFK